MDQPFPEPARGYIRDGVHYFAVRVFFEDTDLSGVVYHANYLRWFERARSDLLDVTGIDQRSAFEAGKGAYAVSELALRYASPARLNDVVRIETRSDEIRKASGRLTQRALRGDMLLCEMQARIAFVGPDGRPRRQPDGWVEALQSHFPDDERPSA